MENIEELFEQYSDRFIDKLIKVNSIKSATDKGFRIYKLNFDKVDYIFRSFSYREYMRYIFGIDEDKHLSHSTYLGNMEDLTSFDIMRFKKITDILYEKSRVLIVDKVKDIVKRIEHNAEVNSMVSISQNVKLSVDKDGLANRPSPLDLSFSELLDLPTHDVLMYLSIASYVNGEYDKKNTVADALKGKKGKRGMSRDMEEETEAFSYYSSK